MDTLTKGPHLTISRYRPPGIEDRLPCRGIIKFPNGIDYRLDEQIVPTKGQAVMILEVAEAGERTRDAAFIPEEGSPSLVVQEARNVEGNRHLLCLRYPG